MKGRLLNGWTSEYGDLNKLYSLWQYADANEREHANAEREARAPWSTYADATRSAVTQVESILLRPVCPITPARDRHTLFDFRVYDLHAPHGLDYAAELAAILPVRQRYSANFGIWAQISGSRDRVLHMWPYKDYEHRAGVRAAMSEDKDWHRYLDVVYPILAHQRSSLLRVLDLG